MQIYIFLMNRHEEVKPAWKLLRLWKMRDEWNESKPVHPKKIRLHKLNDMQEHVPENTQHQFC